MRTVKVLGVLAVMLVLSACDDATTDDALQDGATTPEATPTLDATPTPEASPTPGATGTEPTDGAAAGPAGEALESGCRDLEADGDVYTVADAGEVELREQDGVLELVDVRPASGWQPSVEEEEADEVEIEFRHDDGREYEFEADYDDGRLEVDVCVD